jgi:hypothetical protein
MIGADEDGEAVPPAFNLVVVFLQAGPASPGQVDGWIVGLHGPAPRATKRGIFPHPTFIRSSVFCHTLATPAAQLESRLSDMMKPEKYQQPKILKHTKK